MLTSVKEVAACLTAVARAQYYVLSW